MKALKSALYFCLLAIILSSCHHAVDHQLVQIDSLLIKNPDSALIVINRFDTSKLSTNYQKGYYGILLFKTCEKKDLKFPESNRFLQIGIKTFTKKKDLDFLALSYLYNAKYYGEKLNYEQSTLYALKCVDLYKQNKKLDQKTLGSTYLQLGWIYQMQNLFEKSIPYYKEALNTYHKIGDTNHVANCYELIGKSYSFLKNYQLSEKYYHQALQTPGIEKSFYGLIYRDIAENHYRKNELKEAEHWIKKSLSYPEYLFDQAIRYYLYAEILSLQDKYDSAMIYAKKSLEHEATIYTKRESYRILVNGYYRKKDLKNVNIFMAKYQHCTDSIATLNTQPKAEDIVKTQQYKQIKEDSDIKLSTFKIVIIAVIIFILAGIIYLIYNIRRKNLDVKSIQEESKLIISPENQNILINSIKELINKTRLANLERIKSAPETEKDNIEIEIYDQCLHINDWTEFSGTINNIFNQFLTKVETRYPQINQKELYWCVYELLEVPSKHKILLLNTTQHGLYKMKQRIAQKFNLESAKDLTQFLNSLILE